MWRTLTSLLVTVAFQAQTDAADFHFDITEAVAGDSSSYLLEPIDLKTQFASIESIGIVVSGEYQPGVTGTQPGFERGPIDGSAVPHPGSVTSIWSLALGEVDQSVVAGWLDPPVDGGPFMQSIEIQGSDHEPSIFLPVNRPAVPSDFDFLLDGVFATGIFSGTASSGRVIQQPRLQIDRVSLQINGLAVPEPTTLGMLLIGSLTATCRHSGTRKLSLQC